MVATAVVGFADGHRVMGEVDIAVITWECSVFGSETEQFGFGASRESYRRVHSCQ